MTSPVKVADVRRVATGVTDEFTKYDLLTYSSAFAFQMLYAVIPLAMLTLAAVGLVGWQSLYTDHVAPTLRNDLSHSAFNLVNRTALEAMDSKRLWWASLGLLVTLWGAGAALRSLMTPLNNIYGARETRSWGRRLAVSIAGGAIAIAFLLSAIGVVMLGRLVHPAGVLAVAAFLARWVIALVLLFAAIATLLWTVPAKRRPLEWVSVGSALSVVCWIVASAGFGAYISAVSYSNLYGALASFVVLLIYLHVSAIAFLLGVTVDSLLREHSQGRSRRGRGRTPAGT
ncbi:MAG TPA: YihY/virulence factor BrkB family protein [Gaiellaceae bacterium]|nr:YihY/virulence factor BrkB family protein [Gaiellaceae bacterium]